ncbi:hypothetical protein ISN45_Aa02g017810 [Arabidopsis thaliana x Arabidopsis arenosa]|uniref:Plant thionin family protein n=1 Tax=Arabidopsis thaliana x Arabidopsis arenosa TaxID=1240361 RepID=A0A8T2BN63_9BRAS|nr:hypothetical protein ISN45_Aa02g017810 [Arabidopsis thaliana x Arabidopsis arenosa]
MDKIFVSSKKMENKRLATFVVMMLMIGNLIVESDGLDTSSSQNTVDYLSCLELCITTSSLRDKLPVKCAEQCWKPPPEMNCKMGCVTHRCVSIENHNTKLDAKKTMMCVNSCLDMCDIKN